MDEKWGKSCAQHVDFVFQSFMLTTLNALESSFRRCCAESSKVVTGRRCSGVGAGVNVLDHLPAQLSGGEQQLVDAGASL